MGPAGGGGGGGGGCEEADDSFADGGTVLGGTARTLLGDGGTRGTWSGAMVDDEDGVAGVGAPFVVRPGERAADFTFSFAAELCDPGSSAGSEL